MGDNTISKDVCARCHEDINRQLVGLWSKCDTFAQAIADIKIISERQVIIQEHTAKVLDKLEAKIENMPMQVQNIRKTLLSQICLQPWFKYVVITVCLVTIGIVGTALGINLLEQIKYLPK